MKNFTLVFLFISFTCHSQMKKHVVIQTNILLYNFEGFNVATDVRIKNNRSVNISMEKGNLMNDIYSNTDFDNFKQIGIELRKYKDSTKSSYRYFNGPYLKYRIHDKHQEYSYNSWYGRQQTNKFIYQNL